MQTLFQNTSSFGLNLEQAVNNAGTGSTTSILTQAQNANSTAESNLNSTISTMDARIATQQTSLTAELNAANQTLQEIPMQLNMVNEIYSAITGYNQGQERVKDSRCDTTIKQRSKAPTACNSSSLSTTACSAFLPRLR